MQADDSFALAAQKESIRKRRKAQIRKWQRCFSAEFHWILFVDEIVRIFRVHFRRGILFMRKIPLN